MSENQRSVGGANYSSADIKKKDLEFNVYEKDSARARRAASSLGKKVSNSRPIRGNNKYITISIILIIIATAVSLAVLLPVALTPQLTPEEQAREDQQMRDSTADTVNSIDPAASPDTQASVLADLDAKIAASKDDIDRYFYIPAKANALQKYGRIAEAITTLQSITDELRSKKQWSALADNYSMISSLYADSGDKASALANMKNALSVVDEAAADPTAPMTISGRSYYQSRVNVLESQQ